MLPEENTNPFVHQYYIKFNQRKNGQLSKKELSFNHPDKLFKICQTFYQGKAAITHLWISSKDLKLPANGKEIIFAALKQNPHLVEMHPIDFFTPMQNRQIRAHIRQNIHNKRYPTLIILVAIILGIGLSYLSGIRLWAILLSRILISGALGYIIAKLHQKYRAQAKANYNDPQTISTLSELTEKNALLSGVTAKNWPNYLWSFTHFSTYCYPKAFSAAMSYALEEDEEMIDAIKCLAVKHLYTP